MTGSARTPLLRRAILAGAVALALAIAASSPTPDALAQTAPTAPPESAAPPAPPAPPAAPAAPAPRKDRGGIKATIDLDLGDDPVKAAEDKDTAAGKDASGVKHGIVVEKDGKRVRVVGMGDDREFDSLGSFAKADPALAAMVVAVVAIVFLSPVFLVAIIVAYRLRKARLANETMLRLAERGVVPPAEAMQAIASGTATAAVDAAPGTGPAGTAPLAEQARQLGRRAAVSDMRKGVILAAIGLGFTVASGEDHGPSVVGLVLLFLGLGYLALWWFETRQLDRGTTPPGAAGPQP